MRNKFKLSFEDDNAVVLPEETAEDNLALQQEITDIETDVAEVDDLQAAVEDAEECMKTIDKINDILETSVDNDEGISPVASEIASIAVESICSKLGMEYKSKVTLESFGGTNNRVDATKLALEESKNILTRIWEAIKRAFRIIKNKINDLWDKFFNGVSSAKKALEKLKIRVAEAKGKSLIMINEDVESSELSNAFFSIGEPKQMIENHMLFLDYPIEITERAEAFIKEIANFYKTGKEISEETRLSLQEAFVKFKDQIRHLRNAKLVKELDDSVAFGPFVGNVYFLIDLKDYSISTKLIYGETSGKRIGATLNFKQMQGFIQLAIEMVEGTEKLLEQKKEFSKKIEVNISVIDKISAYFNANFNSDQDVKRSHREVHAMRSMITSLASFTFLFMKDIPMLNIRAAHAAIKYVNMSLDNHSVSEKK